jgi:hypothetical protein
LNQWCFFWSTTLLIESKITEYTVLKGPYTAIVISVLLHLLVLFSLSYSAVKQPRIIKQNKAKVISIKSFLYSVPKKEPIKKIVKIADIDEKNPIKKVVPKQNIPKETVNPEPSKVATPKKPTQQSPKNLSNKTVTKALPTQVTNAVKSETVTTKNKVAGASRGSFSSYDRLSRLRDKLNNQQSEQAFAELTQKRSASIMDAEPFPVPKTLVPLTVDQQHTLNTSTSHVGSITKNDNGTCTIHRAQMLGSPVESSTASFACGESKFDKSFREHMKEVQAKFKTTDQSNSR